MAGHSHDNKPVDVFRKLGIVCILVLLIISLYFFRGDPTPATTVLLAAGFVVLASYTIGELAESVKLPHITGYLLAGMLLGHSVAVALHSVPALDGYLLPPFDHGLLSSEVLGLLKPIKTLALALICLTAGGELKLESLRHGLGRILAILGSQTVTMLAGITGLFWVLCQPWSPIGFQNMADLTTVQVLFLGLVVGSVSLATAPAATIAIINSTGSKGPMTSNILPVVVLKDVVVVVAFSAAGALAVGALGAEGAGGFGTALLIIAASIVLGFIVGGIIHLYQSHVGVESLIFIVGMVFISAELATALTHWIDPHGHPELALVFIAAGFATSNFSSKGDAFIHQVEHLSPPVYVVFFTMAGAELHLDQVVSLWDVALALVGARVLMLVIGVWVGAQVPGTDNATRTFGWMGFISQAGLALTLAESIKVTFGTEIGGEIYALILAGIAMNEVLGPIALQYGLGFAGETAAQRGVEDEEHTEEVPREATADEAALAWARQADDPEAWGPPTHTQSEALNQIAEDLELEMRNLVRDVGRGPIGDLESDAADYLRRLRRDFLRFHRGIATRWSGATDPRGLPSDLRSEIAVLAGRWRGQLLARASNQGRRVWNPRGLQEAVDASVADLPESIDAPLEPGSLDARPEARTARLRRTLTRWRAMLGSRPRQVMVRDLARYHFQGRVAGRMEGLAALTVNAELHLANRTAVLFDTIEDAAERLTVLSRQEPERVPAAIEAFRDEVEQDFRFALDEVSWIGKDAKTRATHILGSATKDFKTDLATYDSPDLPARQRRFARVFAERTRGLTALTEGHQVACEVTASRYAALALVFEVVGLEASVKEAVDEHGDRLRRQLRGKGLTQLERVRESMRQLVSDVDALLSPSERTGPELANDLSARVEPTTRIVEDAVETSTSLRDWLAGEVSDEPLLDAILAAAQGLSERYEVPIHPPETGEWALPQSVPTTEIPFREVTVSFVEAHVTRDLIDVTRRLAGQVDGLVAALQELQRALTFNAELAHQELDVHTGALPEEARVLVREMVLGSWGRTLDRLEETHEAATPWPETIDALVHDAVIDKLDTYRAQVFDGRIVDVRHTLLRQVQVQRNLLSRAIDVSGWLSSAGKQITTGLDQTLGDERIAAIRYTLGLKESIEDARPEAFDAPLPEAKIPTVYRRLFSDHAVEAGDLLTGRDQEYTEALEALRREGPGLFRGVALVGEDTIGRRALSSALIRGLGTGRITRRFLTEPVDVDTVEAWFDEEPGGVVVIEGFEHLYSISPGGFAPLQRFVNGMADDRGRTAWILLLDTPVWHLAARASGLESVLARTLHMRPLGDDELEAALMSRHSMSGYSVVFESSQDLAWWMRDLMSRTEDAGVRHQKTWFRMLHQASGGILHDALQLWMASVLEVDEKNGVMRLGTVPQPPMARLRRLPEQTLLTLKQVAGQGWTTPSHHTEQFRMNPAESQAQLSALTHAGLLTLGDDGLYRIPDHLRGPVISTLRGRGWFA